MEPAWLLLWVSSDDTPPSFYQLLRVPTPSLAVVMRVLVRFLWKVVLRDDENFDYKPSTTLSSIWLSIFWPYYLFYAASSLVLLSAPPPPFRLIYSYNLSSSDVYAPRVEGVNWWGDNPRFCFVFRCLGLKGWFGGERWCYFFGIWAAGSLPELHFLSRRHTRKQLASSGSEL